MELSVGLSGTLILLGMVYFIIVTFLAWRKLHIWDQLGVLTASSHIRSTA